MKRAVALAVLLAATAARADSPKLAEARRAVETVDYDEARRLLLDALRDGGNSPAALAEIYRLSARAAIVLYQRDAAEQYYRRWLAIDPDAALPADTAPKLREPFVAAQAYMAAHGHLVARAQRAPSGGLDVELITDPLAMAHAATAIDATSPPVAFDADHRAHLAAGTRAAILDDHGNQLLVLDPTAAAAPPPAASTTRDAPDTPARPRRWIYWAIPTGAFGLVSAGFGVAAIASYGRAHEITRDSGGHFLVDAEDNVRRGRTFTWITAGAGAIALGCAIPTAIYFFRDRDWPRTAVVPTAGDHLGIAVIGQF